MSRALPAVHESPTHHCSVLLAMGLSLVIEFYTCYTEAPCAWVFRYVGLRYVHVAAGLEMEQLPGGQPPVSQAEAQIQAEPDFSGWGNDQAACHRPQGIPLLTSQWMHAAAASAH